VSATRAAVLQAEHERQIAAERDARRRRTIGR
jgi:hypothetical protein